MRQYFLMRALITLSGSSHAKTLAYCLIMHAHFIKRCLFAAPLLCLPHNPSERGGSGGSEDNTGRGDGLTLEQRATIVD